MANWVYCGACAEITEAAVTGPGKGACPGCGAPVEVTEGEDVFISFSFEDMKAALQSAAALTAAKIRFWLAPLAVDVGGDFAIEMETALLRARVLLLLASPNAARSGWVRRELAVAVGHDLTVIALRLETFSLPPGWTVSLATTKWLEAYSRPFEQVLSDLVPQIMRKLADVSAARLTTAQAVLPAPAAQPPPPLKGVDPNADRYVGPQPYKKGQRSVFFGRDADADALLNQLRRRRSVLIYAPSGAGKSSFINTLLRDRLAEAGVEVLEGGRVGGPLGTLAEDDLANVYSFLVNCGLVGGVADPQRSVTQQLAAQPRDNPAGERVLLLDQFEELFVHYNHEKRPGFIVDLEQALTSDTKLRVIFGMRQEYLANFNELVEPMPEELRPVGFRLNRLDEVAALEVIKKPVEQYVTFAPGVAEHIVHHLSSRAVEGADGHRRRKRAEFIELVHLQIVCRKLWKSLRPGIPRVEMEDLQRAAGVGKSFDQFVDNVLDEFLKDAVKAVANKKGLPPELKDFPPELIELGLVKFLNPSGSRLTIQLDRERGRTGRLPNAIVQLLEEEHLLRVETRGDERWYELSHDLLVEPVRRNNDRKLAVLLATTDLLSVTLQRERGQAGGRLSEYFRPQQDLLRECEPLHKRAILFADEAEFVFRASLGSGWQTTEWSRRLGGDFPQIQLVVLREALASTLDAVRANAVKSLGAVPVPELNETLVELAVSDIHEDVRVAAAESVAALDSGPVFARLIDRLADAALQSRAITALAVVLARVTDLQTRGFEGSYRALEGGIRRRIRRETWKRRLRQHTATLIYSVIPAAILSGVGAGLFKWIPTAFNRGITQPTQNAFMGLYQGFVAGFIWGGVISFALTFHQTVFSRRRYSESYLKPAGAIPYGLASGFFSGVLVSNLILAIYQVHTLRNIGWIAIEGETPFQRWRQAFFVTRFGWSFIISGTFLGGSLALVANRLRSSSKWLEFRTKQTALTGLGQARSMIAEIARIALPYSWPVAIALVLAVPIGAWVARRPDPAPRCTPQRTTECSSDTYQPKTNDRLTVVEDITADYGCQITGGFGVIVGMAFGLVVVGRGIQIAPRDA